MKSKKIFLIILSIIISSLCVEIFVRHCVDFKSLNSFLYYNVTAKINSEPHAFPTQVADISIPTSTPKPDYGTLIFNVVNGEEISSDTIKIKCEVTNVSSYFLGAIEIGIDAYDWDNKYIGHSLLDISNLRSSYKSTSSVAFTGFGINELARVEPWIMKIIEQRPHGVNLDLTEDMDLYLGVHDFTKPTGKKSR